MEYNTEKYKGKVSSFADDRASIEKELRNKKTPERIEYPFRCTSYSARISTLSGKVSLVTFPSVERNTIVDNAPFLHEPAKIYPL